MRNRWRCCLLEGHERSMFARVEGGRRGRRGPLRARLAY